MRISPMANSEVFAISKIAKDCGFHLEMERELERSFAHIWVARFSSDADVPEAFLLAWQAADELDVIALGTAVASRCRGLAKALVEELLRFAHRNAVRRVLLEVRCSNVAALRLYRSLGFEAGRIREDYYCEPTEDGIEMSLAIDENDSTAAPAEHRHLEA